MSKRCPDCHAINEDSRVFCSSCGSPLDAELRLIQDLEKQKAIPSKNKPAPRVKDDDDDYIPPKSVEEKKSPMLWIVIGLIVVIAVAACLFIPK